jgi:CheY-like chemotaxis protein
MDGSRFLGRSVLIVEDDFIVADDLSETLAEAGARVVGPAATVGEALALVDGGEDIDGALIDLNLCGEFAYPVAEALSRRSIPFVFVTGYDAGDIDPRFAAAPRCEKPFRLDRIAAALFLRDADLRLPGAC